LEEDDQLLESIQAHDVFFEPDHQPHSEVKDEEFVPFEKEDLPKLIEETQLDDPCVERGHDPWRVHLNPDFFPPQVGLQFHVRVGQQQICDPQATAQVGEFLVAPVELVMKVVRDKTLDEPFKEGVDAGQVKLGFGLRRPFGYLPELVTEILDASGRYAHWRLLRTFCAR